MIDNRPPMEATGDATARRSDRNLLLSPGRRILMEEEVITPPKGGRPAPETQGAPGGVRAVPKPFPDDFLEDSSRDSGPRRKDIESPVDMLVDTVSCIQKEMAIHREENRLLRTPATSQVVQVPRWAALTTTKVPRFDGTTSWEQYHQVFEAIVRSNGWDKDTAALQLFSQGGRRAECRSFGTANATAVSVGIGGRTGGPLWISGSTCRLTVTV